MCADSCSGWLCCVGSCVMVGDLRGGEGGGGLVCSGTRSREGEGERGLWSDTSISHDNGPQDAITLGNAVCRQREGEIEWRMYTHVDINNKSL